MNTDRLNVIISGSKIYSSSKVVFEDFDFELYNGITVIMGPNGCGKTTLLRIILGLENLSTGKVLYNVSQEDKQSAVLQEYNKQLLLNCSLRENIRTVFSDSHRNNYESQVDDCIIKNLNDWGYDLKLNQTVGSLSGGQKQAFTLARALKNEPNLFVLDEPVSAIDFKRKLQILNSLKQTNQATFTLISSHDINDAISIADTIVVFNEDLKPVINKRIPVAKNEDSIEERLLSKWADELRKEVLSATYIHSQ